MPVGQSYTGTVRKEDMEGDTDGSDDTDEDKLDEMDNNQVNEEKDKKRS
jgi:hypothetical protein